MGRMWNVAYQNRRSSYHHGDLANALVEAATQLGRDGGPEAVVLREAARRVGVSATAAYRHFADQADLLHAVKERAQAGLVASMEAQIAAAGQPSDPVAAATAKLRALGRAYIDFALTEPGLFRVAFCHTVSADDADVDPNQMFTASAFVMLSSTLDELMSLDVLTEKQREHLEFVTWAAVHGLAMLLIDGGLARLLGDMRRVVIDRMLDFLVDGIACGRCGVSADPPGPRSSAAPPT